MFLSPRIAPVIIYIKLLMNTSLRTAHDDTSQRLDSLDRTAEA